jgi:hypothetical protein
VRRAEYLRRWWPRQRVRRAAGVSCHGTATPAASPP